MRKGIKIMTYWLSTLALVLIILPLLLSMLLSINGVQNFVVSRLTASVSRKLGTRVEIGRVDIGLFRRLKAEGVYVEDLQGDTLLYASSLSADVSDFGLFGTPLLLGSVRLEGGMLSMRQGPDGEMNIKKLTDRLKSDKPKKRLFRLRIRRIDIDDFRFSMRLAKAGQRAEGIDFADLSLADMRVRSNGFSLTGSDIDMELDSLSFTDRSGFGVENLRARRLTVGNGNIAFDRLGLQTGRSEITAAELRLSADGWDKYKYFADSVALEARFTDSEIAAADLGWFAPGLRRWNLTLSDLSADARGTLSALKGKVGHARLLGSSLALDYDIGGLPDVNRADFRIDLRELVTSGGDIAALTERLSGKAPAAGAERLLRRLTRIAVKGEFSGRPTDFTSSGRVSTSLGAIDFGGEMAGDGRVRRFSGTLGADGFDVGRLLANDKLGRLSVKGELDGSYDGTDLKADIEGEVSQLGFNGYDYREVKYNGSVFNKQYRGVITSDDPNVDFSLDGVLDFNAAKPDYRVRVEVRNFDLHATRFNRRDSVSRMEGIVTADVSGTSPDNANGTVIVDSLVYVNHIDTVRMGRISLVGDNADDRKFLSLNSSFVDAEFRSRMSYMEVFDYLRRRIRDYVPSLARELDAGHLKAGSDTLDLNGFSLVKADFKQANNVLGIFLPGLQLAEGTSLSFLVNPEADKLSLSLQSDFIERGSFFAGRVNVNAYNQADSLSLFLRADDLYSGRIHIPNFSAIGGLRENVLDFATRFSDTVSGTSALLGLRALVERNEQGAPRFTVTVTPSVVKSRERRWSIASGKILCDTSRIDITNFFITGAGQALVANGVVSRSMEDTLHVDLRNFDLGLLSGLVGDLGYRVRGRLNGHADLSSAMRHGVFNARMDADSLRINEVALPDVTVSSVWDSQTGRAAVHITGRDDGAQFISGYYRPSDRRFRVDAELPAVDLSLLDPFLEGVIVDNRGTASAKLMLTGTMSGASLSGRITVPEFRTTVDFTKVPYVIRDAVIDIENSVLDMQGVKFYDAEENSGEVSMRLDMRSLKNISYDVRVNPNRMLVLNTTARDNDLFYGNLHATGSARIRGDKLGVTMDVSAATEERSAFFLPLSNKANISQAKFVHFVREAEQRPDSTDYLSRRKLMFERRMAQHRGDGGVNMDINMSVTVRPNVDFQLVIDPTVGDIIRARGNGTINMHVNPGNNVFTMIGDYEISEGSYLFTLQNIINKKLIIEPGSMIQWTGDPIDALLNISAVYKLKASLGSLVGDNGGQMNVSRAIPIECVIHLTDRLSQPTITFDVEAPMADIETQNIIANSMNTQEMKATQFFWLMAFNSFYTESSSGGGGVNIGSSGAATGFEFISNQLSNLLSSENRGIDIRYRPKDDYSNEEVELAYQQAFLNNRLVLELEGNYVIDPNKMSSTRSENSFAGNFSVIYSIDRAGNLKAHIFSRTIDRFGDENQGLQESGVGITYKESFDTFGDIVRNFKERFALSEKRRKRREARRAAREASRPSEEDAAGASPAAQAAGPAVGESADAASEPASGSAGPRSGASEEGKEEIKPVEVTFKKIDL